MDKLGAIGTVTIQRRSPIGAAPETLSYKDATLVFEDGFVKVLTPDKDVCFNLNIVLQADISYYDE